MCKAACKLQYKNYSKQSILADSVSTWSPSLKLDYLTTCTDTTSDQQPYQLHIQSPKFTGDFKTQSQVKKSVRQSFILQICGCMYKRTHLHDKKHASRLRLQKVQGCEVANNRLVRRAHSPCRSYALLPSIDSERRPSSAAVHSVHAR